MSPRHLKRGASVRHESFRFFTSDIGDLDHDNAAGVQKRNGSNVVGVVN